jgi:hypothetical protein
VIYRLIQATAEHTYTVEAIKTSTAFAARSSQLIKGALHVQTGEHVDEDDNVEINICDDDNVKQPVMNDEELREAAKRKILTGKSSKIASSDPNDLRTQLTNLAATLFKRMTHPSSTPK